MHASSPKNQEEELKPREHKRRSKGAEPKLFSMLAFVNAGRPAETATAAAMPLRLAMPLRFAAYLRLAMPLRCAASACFAQRLCNLIGESKQAGQNKDRRKDLKKGLE
jgi:predicted DCC family thiol-disulfide oxidoreductase YuxK